VLYASVAEFVTAERRSRGFGLFYTLGIGSSASAPFLFGVMSDLAGVTTALVAVALLVTATLPLTLLLRARLAAARGQ
jgi:MFS transporter, FSR family, fosmidomycin resistance protein